MLNPPRAQDQSGPRALSASVTQITRPLLLAITLGAASALAQPTATVPWGSGLRPITSQPEALPPPPVRPKLSFQARISQALMPILEGHIYRATVRYKNLLSAGDCTEVFEGVKILDSVLNLELGLNARCDFAYAVAQRSAFDVEVCLSGAPEGGVAPQERCFGQRVTVASAPSALKVERAGSAEAAHRANLAFLAHAAHRLAARPAPLSRVTAPPHISFRTAPLSALSAQVLRLSGDEARAAAGEAGYIRWAPLSAAEGARALYVARAEPFGFLDELVLGARDVVVLGASAAVGPTLTRAELAEDAAGVAASVRGALRVTGDVAVSAGRAVVDQEARVAGGARVRRAGALALGDVSVLGEAAVGGGALAGWRAPALAAGAPRHRLDVGGALRFVDSLTLSPLAASDARDDSSRLEVRGLTRASGGVALTALRPLSSPELHITGDLSVSGAAAVEAGGLEVRAGARLEGDLEVTGDLKAGEALSALRGGSPLVVLSASAHTLGVNHDARAPGAAPAFDEVRFKGRVQFARRVTFDGPLSGVGAECAVSPARIPAPLPNAGKLIPKVFDVTCGGVTVRVSALLESVCGNGVREGEELCDAGGGNSGASQSRYCEDTPFSNCRFYRRAPLGAPLDQLSCAGDVALCVPPASAPDLACDEACLTPGATTPCERADFTAAWVAAQAHSSGEAFCALQSPRDSSQRALSTSLNATPLRLDVEYPRLYCRPSCTPARCGDGVLDVLSAEPKEACDDGNAVNNDDCDNRCQVVTSCKLGNKGVQEERRRLRDASALVRVDTTPPASLPPERRDSYYSVTECVQPNGAVVTSGAPQQVIELDLTSPTWVSFETYPVGALAAPSPPAPHPDTFLFLREQCDQVRSAACDDDGGVERSSMIPPRALPAGRHYLVVGGYGDERTGARGVTDVAVKLTCADQRRLVASVLHARGDAPKDLIFQVNTATSGGRGWVQRECVDRDLAGFVQPTSPSFDPAAASTGLGQRQVALELVLGQRSRVVVTADSQSVDPVLYLRGGCEQPFTLSRPGDAASLICNDNATNSRLFTLARLSEDLAPGVYYVVLDSDSLTGGLVNISLSVSDPQP